MRTFGSAAPAFASSSPSSIGGGRRHHLLDTSDAYPIGGNPAPSTHRRDHRPVARRTAHDFVVATSASAP